MNRTLTATVLGAFVGSALVASTAYLLGQANGFQAGQKFVLNQMTGFTPNDQFEDHPANFASAVTYANYGMWINHDQVPKTGYLDAYPIRDAKGTEVGVRYVLSNSHHKLWRTIVKKSWTPWLYKPMHGFFTVWLGDAHAMLPSSITMYRPNGQVFDLLWTQDEGPNGFDHGADWTAIVTSKTH